MDIFRNFGKIRELTIKNSNFLPIKIYTSYAISHAIDLSYNKPLSHGIRLAYLSLHIAEKLELDKNSKLFLFFGSLFHDIANIYILPQLYLWNKNHYDTWQQFDNISFNTKNNLFIEKLQPEEKENWEQIINNGTKFAKKIITELGISEKVWKIWEEFLSVRYLDKISNREDIQIICLSEMVTGLLNFDHRNVTKATDWLRDNVNRYPILVVKKLIDLLEDNNFLFDYIEGALVNDILSLKPREEDDYTLNKDTISKLFLMIQANWSPFLCNHSKRVTSLVDKFAKEIYLNNKESDLLITSAKVHDIGKLCIPPDILLSTKKLQRKQIRIIKRHPYYSQMILNTIPGFEKITQIAGTHHEYLDGSGYWQGLEKEKIGFNSEVLTIADIFEALVSPRPYRKAYSLDKAINIMRKQYNNKLEQQYLDFFIKNIFEKWYEENYCG